MSDDEGTIDPIAHKELLKNIGSFRNTQNIRRATRTEPKQEINEFQLVKHKTNVLKGEDKDIISGTHAVKVLDIVNVLKKTSKHVQTGKELNNLKISKKVLRKPLERTAADRIKRTIGYEKTKRKLGRWDAVVAKNRNAETQIFPLPSETIYVDTSAHSKPMEICVKSNLMLEMEATEAKLKELQKQRNGDIHDEVSLEKEQNRLLQTKLTRDELIARRKELAYFKLRESQKAAKARLQSKIKSKSYHKMLKRGKIQKQMKEFELLVQTNPEAAMEKMNELEKSRILERASLRHKNTGVWAKNLQMRAKYDKDVRKDLAEQLQVSRQLTDKKIIEESDDENKSNEEEGDEEPNMDLSNPWMSEISNQNKNQEKNTSENWRKYWLSRNSNEKLLEAYKAELESAVTFENVVDQPVLSNVDTNVEPTKVKKPVQNSEKLKASKKEIKAKVKTTIQKVKKRANCKAFMENGWLVEEIEPNIRQKSKKNLSIDDIFDDHENVLQENVEKKLQILTKKSKKLEADQLGKKGKLKSKTIKKDQLKNLKDLSFKETAKRPIIDEELIQDTNRNSSPSKIKNSIVIPSTENKDTDNAKISRKLNNTENNGNKKSSAKDSSSDIKSTVEMIDPKNYVDVKLKDQTSEYCMINDVIGDADIDEVNENPQLAHRMTISEAFEDDDIVADFSKDKTDDSKLKNAELDLYMPGWGSWGGSGLSSESTKNKRMLLQLAPDQKRRDDKKDSVYINENVSKQLRSHLVSQVPFPFTRVRDYEASIRSPIGRNYVTETAFRMLTRPQVITRKGTIIEPMDEGELLKPGRKLRNIVDKRIANIAATNVKPKKSRK